MTSPSNSAQQTLGQLVRFAIVGFSLAGVYSAIYWYLATYVMAPMLAVVIAFLVAVSLGFVLHSRWSFRGHGQREDHRLKVKFLLLKRQLRTLKGNSGPFNIVADTKTVKYRNT